MSIKNILIGVSGGIAAYKIPFLVRILKKKGFDVKIVLTPSAEGMVGLDALRTLTGHPVYRERVGEYDMNHIRLEEWADCYLIAPATANTIAKITHGIADNLLTTLFLSVKVPVLVAPAMNVNMWENAATQANIKTLQSRGVSVLPVGEGELACGVVGAGRMLEPEDIAAYIELGRFDNSLSGKKILVVSGPTEEAIDPVRIITNRSSGQMGNGLVRAAIARGAAVTMISGPASTVTPEGCRLINVRSAREMADATFAELKLHDAVIMAAAVSDFRVENASGEKIAREKNENVQLNLISNPDIAQEVGKTKRADQRLVTFALESGGVDRAFEKMLRKGSDFSVYNRIDESLEQPTATQTILFTDGSDPIELVNCSKELCGKAIMEALIRSWE